MVDKVKPKRVYEVLTQEQYELYVKGFDVLSRRLTKYPGDLRRELDNNPEYFASMTLNFMGRHAFSKAILEDKVFASNIFEDLRENRRGARLRAKYIDGKSIETGTLYAAFRDLLKSDKFMKLYEECFVNNGVERYENIRSENKRLYEERLSDRRKEIIKEVSVKRSKVRKKKVVEEN